MVDSAMISVTPDIKSVGTWSREETCSWRMDIILKKNIRHRAKGEDADPDRLHKRAISASDSFIRLNSAFRRFVARLRFSSELTEDHVTLAIAVDDS